MSSGTSAEIVAQLPADSVLRRFAPHLRLSDGCAEACYRDFRIKSAFQPIFSFAHNRPVGFEGLARAWDVGGAVVSPGALLSVERSTEGVVFLDRLLRALHLATFGRRHNDDTWLFLNVSPEVVIHGRSFGPFFREALHAFGISPQRIVVEVTEGATPDENTLESAIHYYREIGCLVAIDDFGAGHSNFDRIWHLRPDIVKLDRVMIARAARDPVAGRCLIGISGLLHEMGSLVLAEGIETEEEAIASLHAEVDLLQGFLLGRPSAQDAPIVWDPQRFDALREKFRRSAEDGEEEAGVALRAYLDAFARSAQHLAEGVALEVAAGDLLALPQVMRCFVLDATGRQKSENITAPQYVRRRNLRHLPLGNAMGANWMHRHYFRRAMANPRKIQISRPYLSLTDPQMCITLSRVVAQNPDPVVFCCDLEYPFASSNKTKDSPPMAIQGTGHQELVRKQCAAQARIQAGRVRSGHAEKVQPIIELAKPTRQATLLDVACGWGLVTLSVAPLVRSALGVDLTPEMVELAKNVARDRNVSNVQYEIGDVECLRFDRGQFDIVTCRAAFDHLTDPEKAFGEMKRVLRPAGKIVLYEFVAPADPRKAALYNRIERSRDPSHTRSLSIDEYQSLIRKSGLQVEGRVINLLRREFDPWMSSVDAGDDLRREIRALLEESIPGDSAGLGPRLRKGALSFTHTCVAWLLGAKE